MDSKAVGVMSKAVALLAKAVGVVSKAVGVRRPSAVRRDIFVEPQPQYKFQPRWGGIIGRNHAGQCQKTGICRSLLTELGNLVCPVFYKMPRRWRSNPVARMGRVVGAVAKTRGVVILFIVVLVLVLALKFEDEDEDENEGDLKTKAVGNLVD